VNKRISLIVGAVLALLAVFLVKLYLNQQGEAIRIQQQKQFEQERQSQVPVLVAKKDIAVNTKLDASMFEVAIAPANQIPPQTASSFEQVLGKEAVAPIQKGEPIMLGKLSSAARKTGPSRASSLSTATPSGKRAITIPVDNIASVGGMVKPGDSVDIISLLSISSAQTGSGSKKKKEVIVPLFQNVSILAVGDETTAEEPSVDEKGKAKSKASSAKTVTLALTPQEANIIAFVQEQGKLRLVLRSPKDAAAEPAKPIDIKATEPVSWDTLLRLFIPADAPRRVIRKEEGPSDTVEIYRGLKREIVPLTE